MGGTVGHRAELVDLPRRLYLPDAWLLGCPGGCSHPGWILLFRHHLQVRCWAYHLQCHRGQVRARDEGCIVVELNDDCSRCCERLGLVAFSTASGTARCILIVNFSAGIGHTSTAERIVCWQTVAHTR